MTVAGVDVRDFDLTYLRSQIGVVTQDSYLFNGTIRDNLLYAKEDATQEELDAACYIANLSDFIANQPEGYETVVGNRGLKLSGGEKQRLSIARVILKDPKILILDEATSALDSITENAIQEALEALMEGRTSIVIAHRLSTILKADRILVVKDGVIAESGTQASIASCMRPSSARSWKWRGTNRMKMEYRQVKERVEKESAALKGLVIKTGIGMLIGLITAIFLFR